MANKTPNGVPLNLQLSPELNKELEKIAADTDTDLIEVIRQALALITVAYDAKRAGRHIVLVDQVAKSDDEIRGLHEFVGH